MKTAEELEFELREIGERIAEYSANICSGNYERYIEDEDFIKLIGAYKEVFELLYAQAEIERYCWAYCSLDNFFSTYEERFNQFVSVDEIGTSIEFVVSERDRILEAGGCKPILVRKGSSYANGARCPFLGFVYEHFFKEVLFRKRFSRDMKDKQDYLDAKGDIYSKKLKLEEAERRNRVLEMAGVCDEDIFEGDDDEVDSDGLPEMCKEKNGLRIDNERLRELCVQHKVGNLEVVEDNVRIARELILVFSGFGFNEKKIMNPEEYVVLDKEVVELVRNGRVPIDIVPITKINISNQFISKLFWQLCKDVKSERDFNDTVLAYLKKKFLQLKNVEPPTLKKKFSVYDGKFEMDFNSIVRKFGEKSGEVMVRLLTVKSP